MVEATEGKFSHDLMMPYTTGVTLALNAIRDAYLVVDAPNCVIFKASQVQGNHDLHASLLSCSGLHRIADTDCTTTRAARGEQRILTTRLLQVNAIADCRTILLTAMSPAAVTGRQYDKVVRDLGDQLTKPVVIIRPGSLKGDWLDGYIWSLEDLARGIELPADASPADDKVAVVGYLLDRNEADHRANLAELERLLAGMSLEMASCWLSGDTCAGLGRVAEAGTIVSLPYGREAARILAERTGARLVECGLPLGLAATSAWLRQIGEATGRRQEAERCVERELERVTPRLEWILPHAFLNRQVGLMGNDPFLLEALDGAVGELGCGVVLRAVVTHRDHLERSGFGAGDDGLLHNPQKDDLSGALNRHDRENELDLVFTNSRLLRTLMNAPGTIPFVELGFPSYYTHALFDRPFLGYRGTLKLVESMANTMSRVAVERAARGERR